MGTARRSAPRSKAPPTRTLGLGDALFTSTQQRVLSLFFGQPERSYFKRELIELAGSGSGALQRELARLVESGLVSVTTIGSQKHYQANRSAPIFEELRDIVTKTVGLVDPIRAALEPLAARIDLAIVHGSVARGQARAGSDVDLLVVARDLSLEELFARLTPAEKRLGRKIEPTLYTPTDYAKRIRTGNPFVRKLLAAEHIVLFGTVDDDREPG